MATLSASRETTIGADGTATIVVGPAIRGESWNVAHIAVATTSTDSTKCYVYRDLISDLTLVEGTDSGNGDQTNTSVALAAPQSLWIRWTGGTPGSKVFVAIQGTFDRGEF